MKSQDDLLQFDREHIWHPYTSATNPLPTYLVESADGVHIQLADGCRLIDGMASWWSVLHGYNHPVLNAAAHQQIDKVAHVMFGGLTHRPAIQLCQTLINITPASLQHVFLSDSGSVSVEVAIKMALQYWQAQAQTNKTLGNKNRLVSLRGGYHGDTFAAMSVCDPVTGMHHLFSDAMREQIFVDKPKIAFDGEFDPSVIEPIRATLEQHHQEIAAFILEPITQGAGGMWFYHPDYLKHIRRLCDEFNILLIADEIATGFGRTGKLFACEWADISPDILCVGKALTGGYLSLAATLASTRVAEGISADGGVMMHGPTFMGNPLACALANANLKLLLNSDWQANIQAIETTLKQGLEPASELENVRDVRVLGAIGVIEMNHDVDVVKAQTLFVENGVWIRPFGRQIYIMPPYITSEDDLLTLCGAMLLAAQTL